jgi:hypothetical protein
VFTLPLMAAIQIVSARIGDDRRVRDGHEIRLGGPAEFGASGQVIAGRDCGIDD